MLEARNLFLLLVCLACLTTISKGKPGNKSKNNPKYKIVCYYTNWSQYRVQPANFFPENVDPKLCTHVIFAFAKINNNSELDSFEWNDESTSWSKGMYQRTVDLKLKNPKLKVLLAVGGWNHNSMPFSTMAKDDSLRAKFVSKAVDFLIRNHLDGLDIDWEYPANRDTQDRPDDKFHFTLLCKELHEAFKVHDLTLTAAVAAGINYINTAYEMAEIHKYLDFINIMAYDLHGAWDNVTGHNAPLYKHSFDKDKTLNVDFAVKTWLFGVPKEKLVLGLSAYGRSFKIKPGFESCPLVDTPVDGAGTKGKYTREEGFLSYYEVCEKIKNKHWNYVWSDEQQVPYAYSNELYDNNEQLEWVGFDDVKSIEIKVKYIMKKGLGGAMFWSLDMDDFLGSWCDQGPYPLLQVINHYLNPAFSDSKLPDASVLQKKSINFANYPDSYTKESYFFELAADIDKKAKTVKTSYFYKTLNMLKIIEKSEIQLYKFCQCKHGKHEISSERSDTKYLTVDCNRKKIIYDVEEITDNAEQPSEDEENVNKHDDHSHPPINKNESKVNDVFNKISEIFRKNSSSRHDISYFVSALLALVSLLVSQL